MTPTVLLKVVEEILKNKKYVSKIRETKFQDFSISFHRKMN